MKSNFVNNLILGVGASAGIMLIQYFDSTKVVDVNRALYVGFSFFAVMTILSLFRNSKTSE